MVSLNGKGKENGHVQAYAPTGAMVLKRWGGLTSKLDDYPVTSEPLEASLPMTKIAIAYNCALTHKILRQKASSQGIPIHGKYSLNQLRTGIGSCSAVCRGTPTDCPRTVSGLCRRRCRSRPRATSPRKPNGRRNTTGRSLQLAILREFGKKYDFKISR